VADRRDGVPRDAIRHSCGAWWTGLSRAHCAAPECHRTFSSDSAAERHRRTVDGERVCVDPETVGLEARAKPWGVCWSFPAREDGGWWGAPDVPETACGK
jgi:hypothetical protein